MRESVHSSTVINGKRYYQPIASAIRDIQVLLSEYDRYSGKEFIEKINQKADAIITHFLELKTIHHNDSSKLLPMVLDFIQNLYETFGVTYFYNLSPNMSYDEYDEYATGQQVLNNIFDGKVYINTNCLIKEDYIMGGSCYHWSLAIKKIFEQLDLSGVTCLINKNLTDWHSFISVQYGSNTRIIDPLPQTKPLLDKKLYVLNEKDIMSFGTGNHNQLLDPELGTMAQYADRAKYKHNVLNKFDHKVINLWVDTMKIELTKHRIIYKYRDFDTREKTFDSRFKLSKDISEYTKLELLEEIFVGIKPIGGKKLLPIVSKKISEEMLFSLFKE